MSTKLPSRNRHRHFRADVGLLIVTLVNFHFRSPTPGICPGENANFSNLRSGANGMDTARGHANYQERKRGTRRKAYFAFDMKDLEKGVASEEGQYIATRRTKYIFEAVRRELAAKTAMESNRLFEHWWRQFLERHCTGREGGRIAGSAGSAVQRSGARERRLSGCEFRTLYSFSLLFGCDTTGLTPRGTSIST